MLYGIMGYKKMFEMKTKREWIKVVRRNTSTVQEQRVPQSVTVVINCQHEGYNQEDLLFYENYTMKN